MNSAALVVGTCLALSVAVLAVAWWAGQDEPEREAFGKRGGDDENGTDRG